jgi:tetratricopeptide (TPR) repeat protein
MMKRSCRQFDLAVSVALCIGVSLSTTAAAGQSPKPETIRGLGTLTFPTSTRSAAAQAAFVRGVLLLHLFEYEDALDAFRDAEHQDPAFALAYWGEAMIYTHPVWNDQDSTAARAALAKLGPTAAAREAKAPTPRERGFVRAVDILYGSGSKAKRDTLYSASMADLLSANPGDDEVRLFYALSLLGLSQGVRDVPTYVRAAAAAESVFSRNSQHPGAAHYWIHGMDDPYHSREALPAARALSQIAPDADHAQHMTSHIFMALGMWDDLVLANENAMRIVNADLKKAGRPPSHCSHYNSWLDYGYIEQGQLARAKQLFSDCRAEAAARPSRSVGLVLDADRSRLGSYTQMWSRYVIDTEDWAGDVASWPLDPAADAPTRLGYEFTRTFAAARRGDLPLARSNLAAYDSVARILDGLISQSSDPETIEFGQRQRVLALELRGVIALKSGASDSGLSLMARASVVEDSMAYEFGPPYVDKPAHELRGESLIALNHFHDAEIEFAHALERTPRRTLTLVGLARAQEGSGEAQAAAKTRAQLDSIWHSADAGVAARASAKVTQ